MTKLREARENAGLKRNFVANKLGISPDHLNVIERGGVRLSIDKIEVLSKLYRMRYDELARIALEVTRDEIVESEEKLKTKLEELPAREV